MGLVRLIEASMTPKNIGIIQNNTTVYSVSGCCSSLFLKKEEDRWGLSFRCLCGKTDVIPDGFEFAESEIGVAIGVPGEVDLELFIEDWTGLAGVEVSIK